MRLGIWVLATACCCPLCQSLHLCSQSGQAEKTSGTWVRESQGPRLPSESTRVSEDALSLEMACLPEIILPSLTVGITLRDQVAADCGINLLV